MTDILEANLEPQPLSLIKLKYEKEKLILNPEYQRDAVWTRSQKQMLIDSILRGFDVPKFYFRVDGQIWDVVDGQQRCRAIIEFLNDEFPLAKDAAKIGAWEIKGKRFSQLDEELATNFTTTVLHFVKLKNYSDSEIEELFLRLQNGTPLNPAEKRRAMSGTMRSVVAEIATEPFFTDGLCHFSAKRFGYEDAAAKILHQQLNPPVADLQASSIADTYRKNSAIDNSDQSVKRTLKALRFLHGTFKGQDPQFMKYMVLTLVFIVVKLQSEYSLTSASHREAFRSAYDGFMLKKKENDELDADEQDAQFTKFTDSARSDTKEAMEYRIEFLLTHLLMGMPDLVLKDPVRHFTPEQRRAIWVRDKRTCQLCGVTGELADFEADHVHAHAGGGQTKLANAQLLCKSCNASKGAS